MNNEKFDRALSYLINVKYCGEKELEYSKDVGVLFSPYEYRQFLSFKEQMIENQKAPFTSIPLKSFNSKYLYFALSKELYSIIENYMSFLIDDINENNSLLSQRHSSSIYKSRLYSEIEGSVNVENVPTTRRRLKELLEKKMPPQDINDIIIMNMDKAINYVQTLPKFNKENLFKLYCLLSNGCLSDENKLKPGDYYRYDSVEVDRYSGCPHHLIDECMNSLFQYVDSVFADKSLKNRMVTMTILPHICHYYILYIHPYFDFNGRTARVVSYWIYLLTKKEAYLPIVSEAINQTKAKYYRALEETRNANNDLTYFLKYIYSVSIDYALCYKNLELIEKHAKNNGIIFTETEMNYAKRILISCKGKFTYVDFLKACNIDMTKQGAFKVLNKFVEGGFLNIAHSKSKTKLFEINDSVSVYRTVTF